MARSALENKFSSCFSGTRFGVHTKIGNRSMGSFEDHRFLGGHSRRINLTSSIFHRQHSSENQHLSRDSERRPTLKDFQHLAGHLNWLLNVLPWGKPATFELYKKTSGKTIPHAGITINKNITEELTWLHDIIPRAVGIRFVDSLHWKDEEADLVMWTTRLYMMIGILSALYHAAGMHHPPRRLLIWTDSLDAVSVFSSLSPSNAMHNAPLRAAAKIIIATGIDLRKVPSDKLHSFHPPATFFLWHGGCSSEVATFILSLSPSQRPVQLEDLDARVALLQSSMVENSTKKGYITGVHDYCSFCVAHSLPLDPTPQTLAHTLPTLTIHLLCLQIPIRARYFLMHIFPDFDMNRSHPLVQATIKGSMKMRGSNVNCKLPLRLHHLSAFLAIARRSDTYDDLLFITLLSACFFTCHRSGEVVISDDKKLLDWRKVIKRSSFVSSKVVLHTVSHTIRQTVFTAALTFSSRAFMRDACPVLLLQEYIKLGTPCMVLGRHCSSERMVHCLLGAGLFQTYTMLSITTMVVTQLVPVEQHSTHH
ncbi:DNA RNA polymerase [Salix suchowensis]|nr:DNA RNA polymerase [Salix suchowensis]